MKVHLNPIDKKKLTFQNLKHVKENQVRHRPFAISIYAKKKPAK